MTAASSKIPMPNAFYRCAGPNCGLLSDRPPLVADVDIFRRIQSAAALSMPVGREIAAREGTLHVCGELCAQKLQSQYMGNVRENELRRSAG